MTEKLLLQMITDKGSNIPDREEELPLALGNELLNSLDICRILGPKVGGQTSQEANCLAFFIDGLKKYLNILPWSFLNCKM